jgi:hypothetical protein
VQDRGVNYRALDELFRLCAARAGDAQSGEAPAHRFELHVSVMEIHNEKLRDLLYDAETAADEWHTAEGHVEIRQVRSRCAARPRA